MDKSSVETNIASEIKRRIFNGEYKEGSSMPTQRELAKEFETSPTTISKSLNLVKKQGFIELLPRRGTRIIPLEKRPLQGCIAVIHAGLSKPSSQEPLLILDGIFKTLENNSQHYRLIYQGDINMDCIHESFSDFAGIIFHEADSPKIKKMVDYCRNKHFPYVIANLEQLTDCNCTWVDHQKTTETAVKLLATFRHKRIMFVGRDMNTCFYGNAYKGYVQGLKKAGLSYDENLVIQLKDAWENDSKYYYNAVTKYLSTCKKIPTAIVACRDYQAKGIWQACTEKGLKVGEDISIVGFDNISWPQEKSSLTTFGEPAKELGQLAAKMIIEQVIYGYKEMGKQEVEAPLILRSSVGPCREPGLTSLCLELISQQYSKTKIRRASMV